MKTYDIAVIPGDGIGKEVERYGYCESGAVGVAGDRHYRQQPFGLRRGGRALGRWAGFGPEVWNSP